MVFSDKRRLTDLLLDGQLDGIIKELRDARISWEGIARAISNRSGVYVTGVTVRGWGKDIAA